MRRFRRFRFAPVGWVRWGMALLICLYLAMRIADGLLVGPLTALAETEARRRGIYALNRVIQSTVGTTLQHGDLITYEKDQEGRIAAFRINTNLVNQVAAQAALVVQDEFKRLSAEPFPIPTGLFSGSRIFGAYGPLVSVRLLPIGAVAVNVKQEFQGEGINQTRHRIWLTTTADVRIILPLVSKEIQVTAEVPITETVIVGPVPSNFYGGSMGGVTLPISKGP